MEKSIVHDVAENLRVNVGPILLGTFSLLDVYSAVILCITVSIEAYKDKNLMSIDKPHDEKQNSWHAAYHAA